MIDSARELLGIREELPLGESVARGDSTSAQVFFQEVHDGIELAPAGGVTVDLGPHGELIELSSNYVPAIHVSNQQRLSLGEAELKAQESAGASGRVRVEGGARVLWLTPGRRTGDAQEARHAYDFMVRGKQIVVDAESGSVLYKRDRRMF